MQHADILALAGLRVDGRKVDEIRRIQFKMGSGGSSADGSCYCEHGLNKVLVLVYGPQEAGRRGGGETQINEQGSISCQVLHAPFSGTERKKRKPSDRKAVEIETLVKQTFTSVVMLDLYQSSEIHFVVNILESDGSTECTIVNACTMALLDAGIAMSDMVIACSVGDVKQRICIDLNMVHYAPHAYMRCSTCTMHCRLSRTQADRTCQ